MRRASGKVPRPNSSQRTGDDGMARTSGAVDDRDPLVSKVVVITGAEPDDTEHMADLAAAARGIWWLVLLRGILAILFGLFALFAPGSALLALVFVFAAYAILDGVTALAVGIRHRAEDPHWGWHVVQGIVSVLAGVIAFVWPGVTVLAILFVIAFWSIVGGIAEVVESFMMRKRGSEGWGWMLAAGIVSVLFGIVLLASPGAALITLLWLVGVYAIVFGVIIVVWAVRLRRAVGAAVKG
jgi:uncharacterized membrane protein HdeD (DUF308 family)